VEPSTELISAVHGRWPHLGPEWASAVPNELAAVCQKHVATPIRVLPARYSFVVLVSTPRNNLVARSTPDPDGPNQAKVAQALAKIKVGPAVHDVIITDTGTWSVMDYISPGVSLAAVDPSSFVIESLVAPFRRIAGCAAPDGIGNISTWLRARLEDEKLSDIAPGRTIASKFDRQHALATLNDLAKDPVYELCHGDASPGNLLLGQSRLWTIDPRGMSGEVAYDLAVLALKVAQRINSNAASVAKRFAQLAGVDIARTRQWVSIADAARV
jgi:streptomycin 6-kinase